MKDSLRVGEVINESSISEFKTSNLSGGDIGEKKPYLLVRRGSSHGLEKGKLEDSNSWCNSGLASASEYSLLNMRC